MHKLDLNMTDIANAAGMLSTGEALNICIPYSTMILQLAEH